VVSDKLPAKDETRRASERAIARPLATPLARDARDARNVLKSIEQEHYKKNTQTVYDLL